MRSTELKVSVNLLERYGGEIRIKDSRGIIIDFYGGNWILIIHFLCKWHIHSVHLLELSFRRSGNMLEEGQKRSGRAIRDFRSRSSEETDEKTEDVWFKTRSDEGRP